MRCFVVSVIWFFCVFSSAQEGKEPKKRYLFLGDSLTAGYGVAKSASFAGLFELYLKKNQKNIEVVFAGVSGSTTASCSKRLKWQLKNRVDYLFLALGANDGLRGIPTSSSEKNLRECLDLAKEKKIPVVFAGMLLPTNYGEEYRKNFEKIYTKIVEEYKPSYIPFLLEGVAGNKDLNLPDGIHPNEKGHKVVFENIKAKLEGVL